MEHSIADRRKALGLTQTELALASRLSRPQISAVETGRHTPNVKAALAIAQALGTTVEELFGESGSSDRQRHVPALGKEPAGTVAVLAVRVGDVLTYHPLPNHGASESSWERADGLFRDGRVELFDDADPSGFAVAGCDPALGLAASLLPGRGPQRLVAIPASTSEAIEALNGRRVHAAVAHGLDFSPLEEHRVELRIAEEWEDHPGARGLVDLIASPTFHRRLEALGGYDLTGQDARPGALAH